MPEGKIMFFSDFYNKDILSVKTGETLGKVAGLFININTKKAKALMVENGEQKFLLTFKRIAGNNEKITVATKRSLVQPNETNQQGLFLLDNSVQAYTHEGKDLGCFVDITLTGEKLIWFDKPYPFKYIAAMKDKTITINLGLKKPKLENSETKTNTSPYVPSEKKISDYSFLEGRIVIRDIIDSSKDVYIKKGTVINNSVIEMAKKGGKLVYLALSSLLD